MMLTIPWFGGASSKKLVQVFRDMPERPLWQVHYNKDGSYAKFVFLTKEEARNKGHQK